MIENQVFLGDCLNVMENISDKSIDMIFSDLPYGVTANQKWDIIIPFDKLWKSYERIMKNNGVIVLFATEPFRTMLIHSNLELFKYDLIWEKNKASGFLNAKKQPLRIHESILIFYKNPPTYNPQKTQGHKIANIAYHNHDNMSLNYGKTKKGIKSGGNIDRYPTSVLKFSVVNNDSKFRFHPAQKPIELCDYLIKTYTNEKNLILDNCAGSGQILLSARNFIGIEKEEIYYKIILERLNNNLFENHSKTKVKKLK